MRKLTDYKPTQFMAENAHYDKDAADYAVGFHRVSVPYEGNVGGQTLRAHRLAGAHHSRPLRHFKAEWLSAVQYGICGYWEEEREE